MVDYSQSGETRNPYGFTFRLPRCFGEIMAHVTLSAIFSGKAEMRPVPM